MAHPDAVRHQIQLRLAALRARPFEALCELAEYATEKVPFGPQVFNLTTYCDREDAAVRIVVQAIPADAGIVWTEAQALGFRCWPSGATESVPERELYEFM